ncbi:MAG: PilZ domain-containing protein [Candidatus Saelkia tenebricola]|nr:PilZ domain-containing protein [Candidatus Saelkia tenebricola]
MDKLRSDIERRRHKRVKVQFSALFKIQTPQGVRTPIKENEIITQVVDLSESGMAILTDYDISPQSVFSSRFTLVNSDADYSDRYKLIEAEGEVCYNVACKDDTYRLGVCFTSISDVSRTAIADFANKEI